MKKPALRSYIIGQPDDENNYEAQPIFTKGETFKAEKKFDFQLKPYSMVMLRYKL